MCLIVKNLPYSTSEEDLFELFGGSGQLARLVLPPTRTLALVEYTEPQDARRSAHPAFILASFHVLCSVGFCLEGKREAGGAGNSSSLTCVQRSEPQGQCLVCLQGSNRQPSTCKTVLCFVPVMPTSPGHVLCFGFGSLPFFFAFNQENAQRLGTPWCCPYPGLVVSLPAGSVTLGVC